MKNNRPIGVCSVADCGNPVGRTGGRGFCRKHYRRFRVHGDPLAGSTYKGDAKRFLEEAARSTDDKCLVFPFTRNVDGYGRVNLPGGRLIGAHVYVCELVHGEKPSPQHEARHRCGNGREGCVSGNHIEWGTRKNNVHDAIQHGTAKFWGVPVKQYGEFRSAQVGQITPGMVGGWRTAANDNEPGRMAA